MTMIAYDIICDKNHKFEGWFKSADDFQVQRESGLLRCPLCGSDKLERMSAPAVRTSKNSRGAVDPGLESLRKSVSRIYDFINRSFEDVGSNFAEEARKIHYEEAKARNIRGTATKDETKALREEGIDCITLPAPPKLNS